MRGPALALLASLTAQPSLALVVEDCEIDDASGTLDCLLTNDGDVAVAELDFEFLIAEDGRTVPWGRGEGRVPVYGGIEPGETVEFSFPVEGLPPSAHGRALGWEFGKLNARDVEGRRIRPAREPSATAAAPSDEEEDEMPDPGPALEGDAEQAPETASAALDPAALSAAIRACWDAGSLSEEARAQAVTIGFDLDQTGRLVDEVRLLSHDRGGDPAADEAFLAAVSAVRACQASGYPAPAGSSEGWGWVVLTFDPGADEIR